MIKTTFPDAKIALDRIKQQAASSKTYLQAQRAALSQDPVPLAIAVATVQHFYAVVGIFDQALAVPGLGDFAGKQGEASLVDDLTQLRDLMSQAMFAMLEELPKSDDGFLKWARFKPSGEMEFSTAPAGSFSVSVGIIDEVLALIE